MFRLIYECLYKVVYYAAWSLASCALSMVFLFAVLMLGREPEPAVILLSLLSIFFFISAILFVYATTYYMIHPNPVNFFREMRLKIPHIFSFSLSCYDVFIIGGMLYLCGSTVTYAYNHALQTEIDQAKFSSAGLANYHFLKVGSLLVYYGNIALAFVAAVLFVYFWMYLFRMSIKIPAFISNHYISHQESVSLTKSYRWGILLISGLINGSLSGINNILISSNDWYSAAFSTITYWVFMHVNIALCVVFYQECTAGYAMRKYK